VHLALASLDTQLWRVGAPFAARLAIYRRWGPVVANQSQEDGWYEAIVVEQNGEMFTLRWRDYPRERRVVRHRLRLGLLYPGPTQRQAMANR
jgi:DNA-binding IclR family transcriptional regulator